jgi:hypothetical protein
MCIVGDKVAKSGNRHRTAIDEISGLPAFISKLISAFKQAHSTDSTAHTEA